jgi:ribonuclease HI
MGIAVVVHDHMGKMAVAGCQTQKGCPDSSTAKALAVQMAIKKCKEMGFPKVHFEGDVKVVIDAVLSEEEDWSRRGNMKEDIKEELCTVSHWSMSFVRREGNKVAHVLSQLAVQQDMDNDWVDPLDCIRDVLLLEQLALAQWSFYEIKCRSYSKKKTPCWVMDQPCTGPIVYRSKSKHSKVKAQECLRPRDSETRSRI